MTNDTIRCVACEVVTIPEGSQWNHDHLFFCEDCLKYLVGYIKYQRKLRKDLQDNERYIKLE